jgi:hypothetical protein
VETPNPTFFTAGHGLYDFMVDRQTFTRSLYYNLLLQPQIVIPDHYFLQGSRFYEHLTSRPTGNTWVEIAIKNDFIAPFYRNDAKTFSQVLKIARETDLRGFTENADYVAKRLDRFDAKKRHWHPSQNSKTFGTLIEKYLTANEIPIIECRGKLSSEDFQEFWGQHRGDFLSDMTRVRDLSYDHVIPISLLIKVIGNRLLPNNSVNLIDIAALLAALRKASVPEPIVRSTRVYFTIACEIYARTLAETLLAAANSPFWRGHIAALHMWECGIPDSEKFSPPPFILQELEVETTIRLPSLRRIEQTSGESLIAIRLLPSADRYFGAVENWRATANQKTHTELVSALQKYSADICRLISDNKGNEDSIIPMYVTKLDDLFGILEKIPDIVLGMVAASASGPLKWGAFIVASTKQGYKIFNKRATTKIRLEIPKAQPGAARFASDFTISRIIPNTEHQE